MFQTLAISSPTSSIPSSSLHFPRRLSSIRCRAATATAESLSRCQARSLYEVLKVKNNASMADIKVAYRRLAKIYHPDAAECLSDGFDFIQIHKAYETLSDPKNRSDYDREIGRMMMSRSVYSSANSNSAAVVRRPGFYQTRRWESDQCW